MCCDACFNLGLSESVRLVAHLYSLRDDANLVGQARFGITSKSEQLGITMPVLRELARAHRRNHPLALELWASGIHDARVLATLVENPQQITRGQMEAWVRDADNWALTDALAFLFDRTEFAEAKAHAWSARQGEFVKRTGFAMMAGMAVHRPELPKKGVNWALRQIGKRNPALRRAAMVEAQRIGKLDSRAARWIAADALRELGQV